MIRLASRRLLWCLILVAPVFTAAHPPADESTADGLDLDPLMELAALGDELAGLTIEGGGSIRAKRVADPARAERLKDARNVQARVELVKRGAFPTVAVRLRIVRPATDGPGAALKKDHRMVVVPLYRTQAGKVAMQHEETRRNAGAYYLEAGDTVMVRVAGQAGKVWKAAYIERK